MMEEEAGSTVTAICSNAEKRILGLKGEYLKQQRKVEVNELAQKAKFGLQIDEDASAVGAVQRNDTGDAKDGTETTRRQSSRATPTGTCRLTELLTSRTTRTARDPRRS